MKLSIIFLAMFALTIGRSRAGQHVTYSDCASQRPVVILRTEEVAEACFDCCNLNYDTNDYQCGDYEPCNDENANEYGECGNDCTNDCVELSYDADFVCVGECGKDRDCIETCAAKYEASVAMCNNGRETRMGRLRERARVDPLERGDQLAMP